MRRPLLMSTVLTLLLTAGGPVAAQEVEPSSIRTGGLIAVPEAGFAVTFPNDWIAADVLALSADAFAWLEERDPGFAAELRSLRSVIETTDALWVSARGPFGEGHEPSACSVTATPSEGATLAQVVRARVSALQEADIAGLSIIDGPDVSRVQLPAGEAFRSVHSMRVGNDTSFATRYYLNTDSVVYALLCQALEPPADDWLSIAETFEFLPDAVTGSVPSSPLLANGRIERPKEGFGVAFPGNWAVEEVTPETHEWLFRDADPAYRVLLTTILWADEPESDGHCTVVDFTRLAEEPPAWSSIDAATADFLAGDLDDPGFIEPQSTYRALPAGRAGHITATDVDGWAYGVYYFTNSEAWYYIECWSPDPPGADWLSIAEAFEFLPVEE